MADDEQSVGELGRNVRALTLAVQDLARRIEGLGELYVTRREWKLESDGQAKDVAALGEKHRELDEGLKWLRRALLVAIFTGCVLVLVWWFTTGSHP